ncbi:hypothetical protein ACJIZ3_006705 [Penstemon smallii]|uniref:Nuclear transport factor 2 domain-containing protein n=1 Tax=Penstemon smallii TaxID=265156 RepID=A0ABD3S8F3_9LAMI
MKMGTTSTTLPYASIFCKTFTNPTPSISAANIRFYGKQGIFHVMHSSFNGTRRGHAVEVACSAKDPGSQDEQTALETVLKLYEAMRNRNVYELSDIIAEECLCISNFVSTFQPFHGKKQVLDFFTSLMKNLGKNIEFVVQNTSDDGMVVGVSWKLEWKHVPLPLGKGISFYMCHVYHGKVMIKNVEMFMEPVLHIEPFRLEVIARVMNAMEKLNLWALFNYRRRRIFKILLILLFIVAIVFFLRQRSST